MQRMVMLKRKDNKKLKVKRIKKLLKRKNSPIIMKNKVKDKKLHRKRELKRKLS